jgi:hypothetical protein
MHATRRSTVYFDPDLHMALHIKSAETNRSISSLINEVVRSNLSEDLQDLAIIRKRAKEPSYSFEEVLCRLKRRGKL